MPTYPVQAIINGQPTFETPLSEILAQAKPGGALRVLSELEYITDQQRRWFKGVCLPALVKADENGETEAWWDAEVKRQCKGLAYLKKEIFFFQDIDGNKHGIGRLTTKGVGKKNMTLFIEEILSQAVHKGWDVAAPDASLRKNK